VWVHNSPAYNVIDCNLFQLLEEDIQHFKTFGKVLILGDMNARVGEKPDYIICDKNINAIDPSDYNVDSPLPRVTQDKVHNSHGQQLIDLCKSTEMRICNGRLEVSGSVTYCNANGSSLIDYLLMSEHDFSLVKVFDTPEFNIFSDHAPLNVTLCAGHLMPHENIDDDNSFIRWDNTKKEQFKRNIILNLPRFNDICFAMERGNTCSVNDGIVKFTELLYKISEPLFLRKRKTSRSVNNNLPFNKAEWFNAECTKDIQ